MKIRFYHWWVYRLFVKFWTPILKERPEMVRVMQQSMELWLTTREEVIIERRKKIKRVK